MPNIEKTSSVEEIRRKLDFAVNPNYEGCGCMGPQGDQPVCPCAMSTVIKWRGQWIKLTKLEAPEPPANYLDKLVDDVPQKD